MFIFCYNELTMGSKSALPGWISPLILLPALSIVLYLGRVIATDRVHFGFMIWNLLLACLPLVFARWLREVLKTRKWFTWLPLLLTLLWLLFLPNSFYLVTDFIHLARDEDISLLYDVVLIQAFALSGLVLGCNSTYIVHTEVKKRSAKKQQYGLIGVAFLLSAFAIYLGRYLEYNSWDVLANPFGIVFDMFIGLANPSKYSGMYTTTLLFFVFISAVYGSYYVLRERTKPNR